MPLRFFYEGIRFKLPHPRKSSSWLKKVITKEKSSLAEINYIFCSDDYLLDINRKYLKHNEFTDIITFDRSESKRTLSADIYISIDRVSENAQQLKKSFDDELHRVMIHGILHLLGYKDKKPAEKAIMRKKEEACLSLRD